MCKLFDNQNVSRVFQCTDAVCLVRLQPDYLYAFGFEYALCADDLRAAVQDQQQNDGVGFVGRDFVVFLQGKLHDFLIIVLGDDTAQKGFGVKGILFYGMSLSLWWLICPFII